MIAKRVLLTTTEIELTNSQAHERKIILHALEALGGRVTIADVVARTGLSVEVVSRLLAEIAAKTSSSLQVCDDGQVRYCFPPNFYYQYLGNGLTGSIGKNAAVALEVIAFVFKISFGLILLSSVVFILGIGTLCRTLLLAYGNDYDGIKNMWVEFFSLFKWLATDHAVEKTETSSGEVSFAFKPLLLNCYLFLFGPGNPNKDLETKRLQMVAQVVRLNEGVVLAEHLSPYTGARADEEKALFQILHRFGGYPTVLDSASIAYIFPGMACRSEVDNYVNVDAYLEEKEWQVTGLSWKQTKPLLMLAFSSIMGASIFIFLILSARGTQMHHLNLFSFFAAYGCLFLFIPAVRFFLVGFLNREVRRRNSVRLQFERLIGEPNQQLKANLEDVERLRRENRIPTAHQVIYRTDRDYLEQLTDI